MRLDRIDADILLALQKNGRLSNKELAAAVGLAPSTCLERVRRLRDEGVIQGFRAEIDPKALGIGLHALISVRLRKHARDRVEAFRAHILSLPEAVAVYHMAGNMDFLVHVAVRDSDHLKDLALDSFAMHREVEHMETSLVFEHARAPHLPMYPKER